MGFGVTESPLPLVLLAAACMFTIEAAFTGILITSTRFYSVENRSTGVGFTVGIGRIGAIVGPYVGGALIGMGLDRSTYFPVYASAAVIGAIAIVAAWGIAGLALLGRADVLGAACGALLIYVMVRGRAPTLYAGVFIMVALLEIYGTAIGSWSWVRIVPGTPLPSGNPPSGIAGAYVLFDIAAIAFAPRLIAWFGALRRLRPRLAG
jgi:hypothetical protein